MFARAGERSPNASRQTSVLRAAVPGFATAAAIL